MMSGKPIFADVGGIVGAGNDGNTGALGEFSGGGFVAEEFEEFGAGSDEGDAGALAGAWQGGIFGEEAVARVDEIDALFFGERDDAFDIEIGLDGTEAFADQVGFVGFEAMEAEAVFFGVNGDGAQPELGGGAHDADRDFATVQGEEFLHLLQNFILGCVGFGRTDHGMIVGMVWLWDIGQGVIGLLQRRGSLPDVLIDLFEAADVIKKFEVFVLRPRARKFWMPVPRASGLNSESPRKLRAVGWDGSNDIHYVSAYWYGQAQWFCEKPVGCRSN